MRRIMRRVSGFFAFNLSDANYGVYLQTLSKAEAPSPGICRARVKIFRQDA
jgi:hypothetical protein